MKIYLTISICLQGLYLSYVILLFFEFVFFITDNIIQMYIWCKLFYIYRYFFINMRITGKKPAEF